MSEGGRENKRAGAMARGGRGVIPPIFKLMGAVLNDVIVTEKLVVAKY